MSEIYDKAVAALKAVADVESERQNEPKVIITLSLTSTLEVFSAVAIAIKVAEERINNDLRRDYRLPNEFERKRLDALREGFDAIGKDLASKIKKESVTPETASAPA